jgi:glutamate formiminotransferase/glutamate formiminotransferase/formiminotetrahydrofolate cyclodeaminase
MAPPILLAVPNVSEGRDQRTIAAIGAAFADGAPGGARLLDVHSDRDHHRSVFTIAGYPGQLADALLRGARVAVERIDVMTRTGCDPAQGGQHPHVGAVDVAPVVYLDPRARGAACAEALVAGDRIGEELEVPVFLYGGLSAADPSSARTRAQLRRGGVAGLTARMAGAEERITPDFGPPRMHPSAGATLLAARPPLVAFNLQLAPPATVNDACAIAALIREGGERGLPGVRAIGVALSGEVAQVSINVERPFELSLAMVLAAVRPHAEVASAELVGLAPAAALEGFPEDIPIAGFDPARHVIENALGC